MKLQCNRPVTVKSITIGGPTPLICLPLVAKNEEDLFRQAKELFPLTPDLLEWRIDAFDTVEKVADCAQTLATLRRIIGPVPLLFTCRIDSEGGMKSVSRKTRLELITSVIRSGNADMVDIEMCNNGDFVKTVIQAAETHGVKTILSFHDFEDTPDEAMLVEKLVRAQKLGADIAKVAVTPKSPRDVLALMNATLIARTEYLDIPMITISMGATGAVTRVAGGLFGSDITFAAGNVASAPGQIPVAKLRQAMKLLYP